MYSQNYQILAKQSESNSYTPKHLNYESQMEVKSEGVTPSLNQSRQLRVIFFKNSIFFS